MDVLKYQILNKSKVSVWEKADKFHLQIPAKEMMFNEL